MTTSADDRIRLPTIRSETLRGDGPRGQAFFQLAGRPCIAFPEGEGVAGTGAEIGRLEINGSRYVVCEYQLNDSKHGGNVIEQLTRRECEIALLIAAGKMNKQIAHQLRISSWTVGTYLRRIFAKLNVRNRTELATIIISQLKA